MNLEKTKYDSTTYVLSSRNIKFKWAYDDYKNSNIFRKAFGIGRGTQEQTVEMDFIEIWLYYGVVGFIIMTFYIFKYGFMFLYKISEIRKDILYLSLFTALFLGFGSSFLAGHVLFSVSSGTYSFLILALSTMLYAKK
ncbi:O-antigen ligase family protein [Caloramator sp. mosi_1]|uniref:O-antigen ligase family protein n=1 Tax=Caloramator sp. mosi_1 TaxID=3023090 RepID=UPI00236283C2|nr:O-antigen ligase family protein [Caloramator sp. mosi_1]WDC84173.1 O-antigen ligase family protein [Caloramator sp. mosi_1]